MEEVEAQKPIRILREHKARIRLTVDLVPEIKVIVYREGVAPVAAQAPAAPVPVQAAPAVEKAVSTEPEA